MCGGEGANGVRLNMDDEHPKPPVYQKGAGFLRISCAVLGREVFLVSGCEEEPPGGRFSRRGGETNGGGLLVGGMGEGRTGELEFIL